MPKFAKTVDENNSDVRCHGVSLPKFKFTIQQCSLLFNIQVYKSTLKLTVQHSSWQSSCLQLNIRVYDSSDTRHCTCVVETPRKFRIGDRGSCLFMTYKWKGKIVLYFTFISVVNKHDPRSRSLIHDLHHIRAAMCIKHFTLEC